jgi:predicted Zn-dependent protease
MMKMRLLFILFILSMSACSSPKAIEIGDIPPVVVPKHSQKMATAYTISGMAKRSQHKYVKSGSEVERVRNIMYRLCDALGTPRDTWPVYIYDGHDVANAFAVNQNSMLVYTGLIRRISDDSYLATILAHEVGHLLALHGPDEDKERKTSITKGIGNVLGIAAMVGAAAVGASYEGSRALGNLVRGGTYTAGKGVITSYDREQEYQADQIGLMLMAKAGYDPRKAIEFWDTAEKVIGKSAGLSFLATHPSHSARQSALKKALPIAMKYYGGDEGEGKKDPKN